MVRDVGVGVALLWTPKNWLGSWVICALVLGATTSSPFGFLILGAAGLRYLVQRSRPAFAVLAVSALGFALQTAAMVSAPPLEPAPHQLDPATLASGYLNRVLGDSVFGVGRIPLGVPRRA